MEQCYSRMLSEWRPFDSAVPYYHLMTFNNNCQSLSNQLYGQQELSLVCLLPNSIRVQLMAYYQGLN